MSNIYYDPEDFGFEIFECIENDQSSYDFDSFLIVNRKEDNKLFYVTDSGCSCPSPFEDKKVEDLTPIVDVDQFAIAFEEYRTPYGDDSARCTVDKKLEVIRKVKEHLENH